MKTLKNQIIEILDKNLSAYQLCHDDDPIEIAGKGNAASEIESLIKENYVEWDFVKWAIIDQEIFMGELSEQIILNDNPKKFYTLKEVYQYWKQNIKNK